MMPGETIESGWNPACDKCRQTPKLDVYRSNAGYYIGTYCKCGPYSRESRDYPTMAEAREAMKKGGYERT